MRHASRLRVLLIGAVLAGCAPTAGASPSVAAPTAPGTGATPAAPTDATPSFPAMTTVTPEVIDVPNSTGVIWLTTDGTTIWAAANGAILRIDAATSKVTTFEAPAASDDTTLQIADDGLWMTRYSRGRVYRLDPSTGSIGLSIAFESAVRTAFVGDDLWVGRESSGEMVLVDRSTGALGRSLVSGAYGVSGLGDLWFTHGGTLHRVDPASGKDRATITVQDDINCHLRGTLPDGAWVTCFGHGFLPRTITRIDPVANAAAAVATVPPTEGGAVAILDGQAWFCGEFRAADGSLFGGLLRLNPKTGAIERFVSIGPAGPDDPIVAGGAIWVPDEMFHRILRIDAAQLAG